jgi:hypothetical protein
MLCYSIESGKGSKSYYSGKGGEYLAHDEKQASGVCSLREFSHLCCCGMLPMLTWCNSQNLEKEVVKALTVTLARVNPAKALARVNLVKALARVNPVKEVEKVWVHST